jgi:hypothetical protein
VNTKENLCISWLTPVPSVPLTCPLSPHSSYNAKGLAMTVGTTTQSSPVIQQLENPELAARAEQTWRLRPEF